MNGKLSAIKIMEQEAGKIKGSVSLAQGIPSFPSHPLIRERVIKAIESGAVDKYSPVAGLLELRELISKELDNRYSPETEIIVTGGAVEAISATIIALFNKGDELIVPTPTYPYYSRICDMTGVRFVPVELGDGWSLSPEQIEAVITPKSRGILICNPNNPTGTILSEKELIAISNLARKKDLIIISDDVYEDFFYDEEIIFNLRHKQELKDILIRVVSLSKSFALSGWRIGFLHGPESLIDKILRIHDNLINCAPVVSQYAALEAIKNRDKIMPDYLLQYRSRRYLMENHLRRMGDMVDFVRPAGTYYFFPKIRKMDDSVVFCLDMLREVGLATVPGREFGPGGEGHVRLCFGRSEEEIEDGMVRMKKYLLKRQRKGGTLSYN